MSKIKPDRGENRQAGTTLILRCRPHCRETGGASVIALVLQTAQTVVEEAESVTKITDLSKNQKKSYPIHNSGGAAKRGHMGRVD